MGRAGRPVGGSFGGSGNGRSSGSRGDDRGPSGGGSAHSSLVPTRILCLRKPSGRSTIGVSSCVTSYRGRCGVSGRTLIHNVVTSTGARSSLSIRSLKRMSESSLGSLAGLFSGTGTS